ncbi:MAG: hypothetical protein ACTSVB_11390 [Candidatus Heimdallarchaeaceae archaeon]
MGKEPLPKVDVVVSFEDVENIIKTSDDEGLTPHEIGKELGLITDDVDDLKVRAILQKVRATARRVVRSRNFTIISDGGRVRYSRIISKGQSESKAEKSSKDALDDQ